MNIKYGLGLTLVIIGLVICIPIYFIVIGFPVFIVGVILIAISKKKALTKLLAIFLPFLGFVLVWVVGYYLFLKPTPLTFLIPEGFSGYIRIVDNEECGVSPKKEEGRLVLEVPANGFLIVNKKFGGRGVDNKYYYKDQAGNRKEAANIETDWDATVGVRSDGEGSIGSFDVSYSIPYIKLIVLNPEGVQKDLNMDSITLAEVKKCKAAYK